MYINYGAGLFLAALIAIFFLAPVVFVIVGVGVLIHAALKTDPTDTVRATKQTPLPELDPFFETPYMSDAQKRTYMQSQKWKELRNQVLYRDNHRCQVTSSTENLEIHHITYARLGDERLSDLVTVSRATHQTIHNTLGYNRRTIYNIDFLKY